MSQKGFSSLLLIIIVLMMGGGLYIYNNFNKMNSAPQENLPDLIIDSVSYRVAPPLHDSFGMPVIGLEKSLEFTIRIKNIGDAPFTDQFYISNSRSNFDFTSGYYSHTQIVNQQKRKLNPGGTLEVIVLDSVDSDAGTIRFLVATDGKTGQKDVSLPKIVERDYQNNTHELSVK